MLISPSSLLKTATLPLHQPQITSTSTYQITRQSQTSKRENREIREKMERMRVGVLALLLLVLCVGEIRAYKYDEGERGEERERHEREGLFMLRNSKKMVKTDAGEVRVLKGYRSRVMSSPMHIGFINMEPNSLFIPQYIDASLIFFVRRGQLRIGWLYKDEMVQKDLKIGDIYRIPAGSAFYMENTGNGERLQLICSIDQYESMGAGLFQSFYIGGGTYPPSVLVGFDRRTMATAFNVSYEELGTVMRGLYDGPIIYMQGSHQPRKVAAYMQSQLRKTQNPVAWEDDDDDDTEEHKNQTPTQQQQPTKWSWRKLLNSILGSKEEQKQKQQQQQNAKSTVDYPDSYNLYDRKPDFQNSYGWSLALDGDDYAPLRKSGVGVYLVNLTAGSMMAPHVNPTATEYGVILKGEGTIQVVYPNGTSAMNVNVAEGDAFWVPRYFPFCQIAARSGPMEFFGFTTSARKNMPQFLAGASSLLKSMKGKELAAALGTTEEKLNRIIDAQEQSVILPPMAPAAPPKEGGGGGGEGGKHLYGEMLMDMMI